MEKEMMSDKVTKGIAKRSKSTKGWWIQNERNLQ